MRIEIHEAETSTPEKPLWLWRIWANGRMSQGFSPSEKEANAEVKLEQSRLDHHWGPVSRFPH